MKHLRLIKRFALVFFRNSIQREIAFRADFFINLLNSVIALVVSVGGITIVFSKVQEINGWMYFEALTVTGMFLFIRSLRNLFIAPSLDALAGIYGELWRGGFDYTLLKPIPVQLYVSIRNWSPLVIIDIISSIVIITVAVYHVSLPITPLVLLKFLFAILISVIILYSIMLILASVAFWWLGTPMLWILDSLLETGRYPVKIYPVVFRNILTWVIPVGLIVSLPAETLLGSSNMVEIILGFIFAVVIYFIAAKFFKISVRKYSSASS